MPLIALTPIVLMVDLNCSTIILPNFDSACYIMYPMNIALMSYTPLITSYEIMGILVLN